MVVTSVLGLISGHTYFYFAEVRERMLLPEAPQLNELVDLLLRGKSIITIPDDDADEASSSKKEGSDDADDEDGEEDSSEAAEASGGDAGAEEDEDAAPAAA